MKRIVMILFALNWVLTDVAFGGVTAKQQINFINFGKGNIAQESTSVSDYNINVDFKTDGKSGGYVKFLGSLYGKTKDGQTRWALYPDPYPGYISVNLHRADPCVLKVEQWHLGLFDIGTVSVDRTNEDIFFVCKTQHSTSLNLLNPKECAVVTFEIEEGWEGNSARSFLDYGVSNNYYNSKFKFEKQFLEKIRFDYGFVTEEQVLKENNPMKADTLWAIDNKNLTEGGTIQTRRFKGYLWAEEWSRVEEGLEDGQYIYKRIWNRCLVAYDKKRDESFVLITLPLKSPVDLQKVGDNLVINVGSGKMTINMKTMQQHGF